MRRYDRLKDILRLDPEKDCHTIYRWIVTYEFPWDVTRALEFALFRTYAVPGIGALLARTAELTERSQKRYDDTSLLLDAVVEHGFDSAQGRTAVRRINQMHRAYTIPDDEMRYVLCTFVVTPTRWLDAYGWRALTNHERRAVTAYYRTLGARMGIRDLPESYAEFEHCMDAYEAEHYGYDAGGRAVADATLALMATWYPRPLAPLVRRGSIALMDDRLLRAFRYPAAGAGTQRLVRGALRLRARAVRLTPPRRTPRFARHNPRIRSYPGYPDGYALDGLGTFPRTCPVPHDAPAADS
ncbi:oxygenase MpaB family protein [Streptomyces sp. TRM 70351]|uniref:oxygenase MpaB family protein n=1 Tax=Streptomyces sp. TRM 70351 TaxID=3116552 RepID=UPI002E7BFAF3|nr:oxygenase MpaB family protein [Streptomyces sp. TRM 70351]MEE1927216.1 oxygenase MpaB family protein [Streptomyces sp. TRM 70351]